VRFLADENVPLPSVDALSAAGHDVAAVARKHPGLADPRIFEQARREDRILITFDRDFGELVFARGSPAFPGVIYLRFTPRFPTEPGELLAEPAARPGLTFTGFFTVLDRAHMRQRPLLGASGET
jgi:predicted nuclease of predicted toxin-antitoxin system